MKKIIFFSKDLHIGGMEKALVLLLNNLVKYYEVTLVLENYEGELIDELNNNVIIKEYKLSSSNNIFIRKISNFIKRMIWLFKNKNKFDFSCNYATYNFWGSRLALIASKNSALYVHSNYYKMFKNNDDKTISFFNNHQINKFNSVIFVSSESKLTIEKLYPNLANKFLVINNLIDYENVLELANKELFYMKNDSKNFCFIGRLENESKNLKLLLECFRKACSIDNTITLYIIGDGSYKDELLEFIKKNKLENNIIYLGQKINPYPILKQSDCLILTSNYEGYPVVYLEALILNKQVITTISTNDELIDVSKYFEIEEKNIDSICSKILGLKKRKINYNLDFKKINDINLKKIRNLIGE